MLLNSYTIVIFVYLIKKRAIEQYGALLTSGGTTLYWMSGVWSNLNYTQKKKKK